MADITSIRIAAPVNLDDCKVVTMSDGARYLVDKTSGERLCRAYGFEKAVAGAWRSKSSFFAKPDEEGFWLAYDDREVVGELD